MHTLTKAEIVEAVYAGNILENKKRSDAKDVVEDLLELMKNAVVDDHALLISGFGKFEAYGKADRRGRNPVTNEPLTLPGRTVVVFRLSRRFRDELNGADSGRNL